MLLSVEEQVHYKSYVVKNQISCVCNLLVRLFLKSSLQPQFAIMNLWGDIQSSGSRA